MTLSALVETGCASIQVSLMSAWVLGRLSVVFQTLLGKWAWRLSAWAMQCAGSWPACERWCWLGVGGGCKHKLGSLGSSHEVVEYIRHVGWCGVTDCSVIRISTCFRPPSIPPLAGGKITQQWSAGGWGSSATLFCCHLGQEPAARKNAHNFYLAEFLSVHAPPRAHNCVLI